MTRAGTIEWPKACVRSGCTVPYGTYASYLNKLDDLSVQCCRIVSGICMLTGLFIGNDLSLTID